MGIDFKKMFLACSIFLLCGGYSFFVRIWAQEGVTHDEILLGQSCALEGPSKELGIDMHTGLEACFAKINATGGFTGERFAF
jgi:ABC-type branched-subunit amino acid transport system substrate-binding protein